jgi:hypothetical protein
MAAENIIESFVDMVIEKGGTPLFLSSFEMMQVQRISKLFPRLNELDKSVRTHSYTTQSGSMSPGTEGNLEFGVQYARWLTDVSIVHL